MYPCDGLIAGLILDISVSVERIAFYPKRHWLLRGGVFKSADVLAPKYCGWMSKSSRVHLHLLLTGEFFLEHEEIFSLHFWCMICFLSEAEDFLLAVNRWLSSRSVTIFPLLMLNALPLTSIRGVLASVLMLKLSLGTQNARSFEHNGWILQGDELLEPGEGSRTR